MSVKVYLVMQRRHVARDTEPNVEVLDAKLTREAADQMCDAHTGTFIRKVVATK